MIDANIHITYTNHGHVYFTGDKRVKLACKPDIGDEVFFHGPADEELFEVKQFYFGDNGVLEVSCSDRNYDYVQKENVELENYLDAEADLEASGVKITRSFEYNKLAEHHPYAKA